MEQSGNSRDAARKVNAGAVPSWRPTQGWPARPPGSEQCLWGALWRAGAGRWWPEQRARRAALGAGTIALDKITFCHSGLRARRGPEKEARLRAARGGGLPVGGGHTLLTHSGPMAAVRFQPAGGASCRLPRGLRVSGRGGDTQTSSSRLPFVSIVTAVKTSGSCRTPRGGGVFSSEPRTPEGEQARRGSRRRQGQAAAAPEQAASTLGGRAVDEVTRCVSGRLPVSSQRRGHPTLPGEGQRVPTGAEASELWKT